MNHPPKTGPIVAMMDVNTPEGRRFWTAESGGEENLRRKKFSDPCLGLYGLLYRSVKALCNRLHIAASNNLGLQKNKLFKPKSGGRQ